MSHSRRFHGIASDPGFDHLLGRHLYRAQRPPGTAPEPDLAVARRATGEALQGCNDLGRSAEMGHPTDFSRENMDRNGELSIAILLEGQESLRKDMEDYRHLF